jgi:hypothetical protein
LEYRIFGASPTVGSWRERERQSERTTANRRLIVKKLFWWLRREGHTCFSVLELRDFFVYINRGHKEPGGRWGNSQQTREVKSSTVATAL